MHVCAFALEKGHMPDTITLRCVCTNINNSCVARARAFTHTRQKIKLSMAQIETIYEQKLLDGFHTLVWRPYRWLASKWPNAISQSCGMWMMEKIDLGILGFAADSLDWVQHQPVCPFMIRCDPKWSPSIKCSALHKGENCNINVQRAKPRFNPSATLDALSHHKPLRECTPNIFIQSNSVVYNDN